MLNSFLKQSIQKNTHDFILIISENPNNADTIYEYLCLKGISNSKKVYKNPLEITSSEIKCNIQALILYAGIIEDIDKYCNLIERFFSKAIPCIILGQNDSIKIHQEFLSRGIFYLDWETQLDQIYEKIFNFSENIQNKKSIKISVLGTKGGCGNSFLSYQMALIIYKRFKSLVLNVQGPESSFNLDLLSGKVFEKEHFNENEVCLYKESKEDGYNYHNQKHFKFNFILYDHSIQGLQKEFIETILNESDISILTITNDIDSLRKAKEVLRINEFLLSVHQGSKKIYICFNQNHTNLKNTLQVSDMQDLIESRIHSIIPYQNIDKTSMATDAKGKTLKELESLVDKLMGISAKKARKWF
ncbi:hypothetical protein [Helicobacter cappadocius]|uniref:Uncharacterized protein n=1 Tax=Helicobacter cappadocius TaxID=3063998 RepID=A0AA90PU31_9HELI|nr:MULTISPECIES: hypothetical protein [unclassified Helicobacter]MDO7253124.1 hypothetical protein [Helicobacter sp. faydin-H75]MDP2538750.1 hypothetical protein [Helicobacter sp. faydin-H76]